MNIDLDNKKISCECGFQEDMEETIISMCPDCNESFYEPQCNCNIEFIQIPNLLFNYILSYQEACAFNHENNIIPIPTSTTIH